MYFMYSGTRNHSFEEITGWLTEAGLSEFNRIDLPPGGRSSLVTAVKRG
jgi:hypothetical protein